MKTTLFAALAALGFAIAAPVFTATGERAPLLAAGGDYGLTNGTVADGGDYILTNEQHADGGDYVVTNEALAGA